MVGMVGDVRCSGGKLQRIQEYCEEASAGKEVKIYMVKFQLLLFAMFVLRVYVVQIKGIMLNDISRQF